MTMCCCLEDYFISVFLQLCYYIGVAIKGKKKPQNKTKQTKKAQRHIKKLDPASKPKRDQNA